MTIERPRADEDQRRRIVDASGNAISPRRPAWVRLWIQLPRWLRWFGIPTVILTAVSICLPLFVSECHRQRDSASEEAWRDEQRRSYSQLAELSKASVQSLMGVDEEDRRSIEELAGATGREPGVVLGKLKSIKEKYADLAVIPFLEGNVFLQSRSSSKAVRSYEGALALRSDFPEAWVNQAIAYQDLGRAQAALASCDSALAYRHGYPLAWNERGNVLNETGAFHQALASFDSALVQGRQLSLIWSNRGIALSNLGRIPEAIASYDSALARDGRFSDAWFNRGVDLALIGRTAQARAAFDQVLSLNRRDAVAWLNHGATYHREGQHALAVADYDSALTYDSDFPEGWANRASALVQLGRPRAAIASIDSALAHAPTDWPMRTFLVRKREELRERAP